jgi:hypothetical protein
MNCNKGEDLFSFHYLKFSQIRTTQSIQLGSQAHKSKQHIALNQAFKLS